MHEIEIESGFWDGILGWTFFGEKGMFTHWAHIITNT
jgi:hypothetical protein